MIVALALAVVTFTNPVYSRDFPDPFVLKAGSTYSAYATNLSGANVQTATSRDLVHWTRGRDALPRVGTWGYTKPLVCQHGDGGSIDASPFGDGDGSLYLHWKNDGNAWSQDHKKRVLWIDRLGRPRTTTRIGASARSIPHYAACSRIHSRRNGSAIT